MEYGHLVRILPGEMNVSRMTPLRMGRVPLCGLWHCQLLRLPKAYLERLFADPQVGAQSIRLLAPPNRQFRLGVAVAG